MAAAAAAAGAAAAAAAAESVRATGSGVDCNALYLISLRFLPIVPPCAQTRGKSPQLNSQSQPRRRTHLQSRNRMQ